MDSFLSRVMKVQSELKAPKSQFNKFGGYNYRSSEDIMEAAKPLLLANKMVLTVGDEMVQVGDRYYIKATATLFDTESPESLSNTAYAREAADKKGMDDSQITGSTSSYARKYALNGLFCLDDTKDADADEFSEQASKKSQTRVAKQGESTCLCGKCGKPITDVKKKDNTIWPASEMVKYSSKRFGQPLCGDCMKEQANDHS